jgi:hypothetical protein
MLQLRMSLLAAVTTGLLGFVQPAFAEHHAPPTQASTSAEHEAAAGTYEKEAAKLRQKAAKHRKNAELYKLGGNPKAPTRQLVKHCENLADEYSDAAKELEDMARLHRDLAALVGK